MRRAVLALVAAGGLAFGLRKQIGRLLTRLSGTWIGNPDARR